MSVFLRRFRCSLRNNAEMMRSRWGNRRRNSSIQGEFTPFLELIEARRAEARRSILVQVQSAQSFKELFSYCNSLGTVNEMQHYCVGVEPLNFIIVEFVSEKDVYEILSQSSHVEDTQVVPVHSQFLWFRASNRKLPKLKQSKIGVLGVENGTKAFKPGEILDLLRQCDSVSSQMSMLYQSTKLNDTGTRLRFLTARQVENAVKGMFPKATAYPFGSSVNGYGKMGCDLDLVLRLCNENVKENARLVFHSKAVTGSERTSAQRNMECIGDLLQLFLPGCSQVRRILQARVPIIKYHQQLTDVECDLSMSNMSGVHMSDFLYMMGALDPRVRPLIFTIRKWASEIGLTNSSPGRWITNFSLTLLVIAFLQRPLHSPPILPSFNTLIQSAPSKDVYITEDGINCTFLRNITQLQSQTKNAESLQSLLGEFFEFCSQFDFGSRAICLNEAGAITKPEHCALYIVNPLERGLNVSKNVSVEELDRFKVEARNAAWLLELQENTARNGAWGLLSIFENKLKPRKLLNFSFPSKSRLIKVSSLFEGAPLTQSVEFKNEPVKRQVESIENERSKHISEMKKSIR